MATARALSLFDKHEQRAQEPVYPHWVRVELVREEGVPYDARPECTEGANAGAFLAELLKREPRETFLTVCLDTKNCVNGVHRVSIGTLDSCPARPREVFQAAILSNASSVILAHNHPSGDPAPSETDVRLTERLIAAGEVLGIDVLDHLVVGHGVWASMRKQRPDSWDGRG